MTLPERNPKWTQPLALMGHQRDSGSLQEILERWEIDGPVALISAGWEEDEEDDQWVRDAIDVEVINSKLYQFADELFLADQEVLALLRERQDRLRELRDVNEVQTTRLSEIARELWMRMETQASSVPAYHATMQHLRDVDRRYLESIGTVIGEYDRRMDSEHRPSIQAYRQRTRDQISECSGLLLAGGHVGVLLNRLYLSGILDQLEVPVIAWSGGAMALGDRVYWYDHNAPHGKGEIEVSRRGMCWYRGVQLFPLAAERLHLSEPVEMALLANRLEATGLAMGPESRLEWDKAGQFHVRGVRCLGVDGTLEDWPE